jgi:hypothetical protein
MQGKSSAKLYRKNTLAQKLRERMASRNFEVIAIIRKPRDFKTDLGKELAFAASHSCGDVERLRNRRLNSQ